MLARGVAVGKKKEILQNDRKKILNKKSFPYGK